jgi:uncharacterized membrane protein YkvA (DUF1232 family)
MSFLDKFGRRFLGKIPFARELLAIKYFMADPNSKKSLKFFMWFTLVYLVFPVDLIPDIFFPLGYSEDIGIVAIIYYFIKKYLKPEHMEKAEAWFDGKNYTKDKVIHLEKDEWTVK